MIDILTVYDWVAQKPDRRSAEIKINDIGWISRKKGTMMCRAYVSDLDIAASDHILCRRHDGDLSAEALTGYLQSKRDESDQAEYARLQKKFAPPAAAEGKGETDGTGS